MKSHPVAPDHALALTARTEPPDADEDDDLDPALCRICFGPVRICGGAQRCTTGALGPSEQNWMTAIRLVYVGVCLTSTPASLWGGAMLRLARRTVPSGLPNRHHVAALALEHADPGGEDAARCTALALRFLGQHGLGSASPADDGAARELYLLLRPRTAAPWLREMVVAAQRAAVATPIGDRVRFPLFTVLCPACAVTGRAQFGHVGTYDEAIRCPGCLVIHRHPIRAVTIGAPHPVGRCLPDPTDPRLCMVHEAPRPPALDTEGLCAEGRATLTRAEAIVAELGEPVTPAQRTLFDAVARAKDVMPDPIVAAVAKIDPEAARELGRIPGLGTIGEMAASFLDDLSTDIRRALRLPAENAKPKAMAKPTTKKARKGPGTERGT